MAMLGGAALVAALIRRIAGQTWIDEQKERIDGLSVIALFVFAVAPMDGVAASIISSPLLVLGLIALAFALSLVLTALTALVLARAGLSSAMALGLAAGSRNMGLMLAAGRQQCARPDLALFRAGAIPDLSAAPDAKAGGSKNSVA
jgi:hypothetical protein